ncbi:MAG TPA: 3D domain-containing protein [Solirubrobacteraceae bacterium]|nr:3D domain-containing protein [Solirubrobacteraceae bacterium]
MPRLLCTLLLVAGLWLAGATAAGAVPAGGTGATGGAPILSGGLAPTGRPHHVPAPPSRHDRGHWLSAVTITEYWPAPESWFVGRMVSAPGLAGRHHIDWLYSAAGVSMQGEGIGLDGRLYRIAQLGSGGWVTADGRVTNPADGWSAGAPFWRAGAYWSNRRHGVTYPLAAGGWSAGPGRSYHPLHGVSFAPGASLPLRFDQSLAVDPRTIPLGSRVYVPAYRHDGHGGWFVAADTGGAISGRHIDVYRSPPSVAGDPGQFFSSQRIYVIRPRH